MAIKLIRARSLAVLPAIAPFLLPDDDLAVSQKQLLQTLEALMVADSENLMLLVGLDEEAEVGQEVKSFLIAVAPVGMNYVLIDQCWVEPQTSHLLNLSESMFGIIKAWARDTLGRDFIRMETKRDPRAMTKKFGFLPVSTTMAYSVKNENEVLQEFDHGKVQRTKDNEHDDKSAEGHQHGDHELPPGEDGTDGDTLRGAASSGPVSAVPASTGTGSGTESKPDSGIA